MILAQGTLAYSLTSVMGAIPAEMDAMCCGEPVRHPTQKSRVGLTPGNPHAFPRIRIRRGRRVLAAELKAENGRCRGATALAHALARRVRL